MIDHGQDAEPSSVVHLVVYEVHAPVLVRCGGRNDFPAQQRNALASLDLHAQLQAFESIQPIHTLLANLPTLSFEHRQNTQVANLGRLIAMSRMRLSSAL
jgi:hypothetical protein